MQETKKHIRIETILPVLLYGGITGALVGLMITLFKFCAHHVISLSTTVYALCTAQPGAVLPVLFVLALLALGMALLTKRLPNVRGGGIPTSIGILRGVIPFRWLSNLFGVFLASMTSFLIGAPLGTEGPSVQIGTLLGRGVARTTVKKHAVWDRYMMTGGACAGFAAATGAPIAGILFAIEEAHQRISPLVFSVAATAVAAAQTVSEVLCPWLGVDVKLFPSFTLPRLAVVELWLPVVIGLIGGGAAILFLHVYRKLNVLWDDKTEKIPAFYKYIFLFGITLLLGILYGGFISTGHGLIETLMHGGGIWYLLLAALIVRSLLMILCSANGVTGGLFLPILSLGAILAALIGRGVIAFCGVPDTYYPVIVMLGVTTAIAGMMKMPVTAVVFAVEALSASENILAVIITAAIAYAVTEIFYVDSINEHVLEDRIHELHKGKHAEAYDARLVLQEGSFAIGKQVRDLLFPNGLVVLSFKREKKKNAEVDAYGEKVLRPGDELHVRYSTYDHTETLREIEAIVGKQEGDEKELRQI